MTLLDEVKAALKPFADVVFDDNGDVTISTGHIHTGDYMRARRVLAAIDRAQAGLETTTDERDRFTDQGGMVFELAGRASNRRSLVGERVSALLRDIDKLILVRTEVAAAVAAEREACARIVDESAYESDIAAAIRARTSAGESKSVTAPTEVEGYVDSLMQMANETARKIADTYYDVPKPSKSMGGRLTAIAEVEISALLRRLAPSPAVPSKDGVPTDAEPIIAP